MNGKVFLTVILLWTWLMLAFWVLRLGSSAGGLRRFPRADGSLRWAFSMEVVLGNSKPQQRPEAQEEQSIML
jgi:hypothetical protein